MKIENCFLLGKISRKHGYKGELNIKLDISSFSFLRKLDHAFVKIDNTLIPYFISSLRFKNNNVALVKFEDVNSENEASLMIGKKVYLPIEKLPEKERNRISYLHFTVVDNTYGKIGKIIDIQNNQTQSLFVIAYQEKEVLVPIVDQFITNIDLEKREIYIKTPPGLIDLF